MTLGAYLRCAPYDFACGEQIDHAQFPELLSTSAGSNSHASAAEISSFLGVPSSSSSGPFGDFLVSIDHNRASSFLNVGSSDGGEFESLSSRGTLPFHSTRLQSNLKPSNIPLLSNADDTRSTDSKFFTSFSASSTRHLQIVGKEPPGGYGDGNDSPCVTCGCPREKLQDPDSHMRTVCPNVPQHRFYTHFAGQRLKYRKLMAFWVMGSGVGVGSAWCVKNRERFIKRKKQKKQKDLSGRVDVTDEPESSVGSASDSESDF